MKNRRRLFPMLLLLIALPVSGRAFTGKVVDIPQGDTIIVLHDEQPEKVGLYGIDCPEKEQAFWKRAMKFTKMMVKKASVDVEPVTKDADDRILVIIKLGGLTLNKELVWVGLAWVYEKQCKRPECEEWKEMEAEARRTRRGLWADPKPVPPWEFRRQRKR